MLRSTRPGLQNVLLCLVPSKRGRWETFRASASGPQAKIRYFKNVSVSSSTRWTNPPTTHLLTQGCGGGYERNIDTSCRDCFVSLQTKPHPNPHTQYNDTRHTPTHLPPLIGKNPLLLHLDSVAMEAGVQFVFTTTNCASLHHRFLVMYVFAIRFRLDSKQDV